MKHTLRLSVHLLVAAFAFASPLCAASARPSVRALQANPPPVIDGKLDDPCWQGPPSITEFVQVLPVEGAAPTEATEVRFARDARYLYIALRCLDSGSDRILAPTLQRDTKFDADDVVRIALDTFGRERDGYLFLINPAGARTDALFGRFGGTNYNWDALWIARTSVDDRGWSAEIAIPTTSLSFDPASDDWRINIERVIRRKQETVRWSGANRTKSVTALEEFGTLAGMAGLKQGHGVEFTPYVRFSRIEGLAATNPGNEFDTGFDLTWRITPSLTAIGTMRPDFAETEIDDRVVNLSRFPTYFPEKRDFFLEDVSLFSFGGLDDSSTPFYSRRIGLGLNDRPVDIVGAARLTGRIERTSVALLAARQDDQPDVPARTLAVARITQQVLDESSVGLIATLGDPRSARRAWLAGADFSYLNSRLADGRQVVLNGFAMVSDTDATAARGEAFGFDLDYPNEPLDVHLFFRHWGEHFDPTLGFVDRVGIREYVASVAYLWRPNTWLRTVELEARPLYQTNLHGQIVQEDHDVPTVTFKTPAGDVLQLEYTFYRDRLDEPFEVWPSVILPAGDYRFGQFKPSFETSAARPWSAGCSFGLGQYYGGTIRRWKPKLEWRVSRHVNIGASFEERRIELARRKFAVRVASGHLNLALSPEVSLNTLAQYDNESRNLAVNCRLRWTFRPGCDLFLVFNQGWLREDDRYVRQFTGTTTKLEMSWRI